VDWYQFALNDWDVYHDSLRIKEYVSFSKITESEYESIVGETYTV
jgi:hypothetical protein